MSRLIRAFQLQITSGAQTVEIPARAHVRTVQYTVSTGACLFANVDTEEQRTKEHIVTLWKFGDPQPENGDAFGKRVGFFQIGIDKPRFHVFIRP